MKSPKLKTIKTFRLINIVHDIRRASKTDFAISLQHVGVYTRRPVIQTREKNQVRGNRTQEDFIHEIVKNQRSSNKKGGL